LLFVAVGGFFQGDFHVVAQIGAAIDVAALAAALAGAGAAAKDVAKDVGKGVAKAAKTGAAGAKARTAGVGVYASVAVLVVSGAFLAVREDFVGFFDFLEFLFGFFAASAWLRSGWYFIASLR